MHYITSRAKYTTFSTWGDKKNCDSPGWDVTSNYLISWQPSTKFRREPENNLVEKGILNVARVSHSHHLENRERSSVNRLLWSKLSFPRTAHNNPAHNSTVSLYLQLYTLFSHEMYLMISIIKPNSSLKPNWI